MWLIDVYCRYVFAKCMHGTYATIQVSHILPRCCNVTAPLQPSFLFLLLVLLPLSLVPLLPPMNEDVSTPGRCYPCVLTIDIKCNCGATKLTVPCGREKAVRPPKCRELCKWVQLHYTYGHYGLQELRFFTPAFPSLVLQVTITPHSQVLCMGESGNEANI